MCSILLFFYRRAFETYIFFIRFVLLHTIKAISMNPLIIIFFQAIHAILLILLANFRVWGILVVFIFILCSWKSTSWSGIALYWFLTIDQTGMISSAALTTKISINLLMIRIRMLTFIVHIVDKFFEPAHFVRLVCLLNLLNTRTLEAFKFFVDFLPCTNVLYDIFAGFGVIIREALIFSHLTVY